MSDIIFYTSLSAIIAVVVMFVIPMFFSIFSKNKENWAMNYLRKFFFMEKSYWKELLFLFFFIIIFYWTTLWLFFLFDKNVEYIFYIWAVTLFFVIAFRECYKRLFKESIWYTKKLYIFYITFILINIVSLIVDSLDWFWNLKIYVSGVMWFWPFNFIDIFLLSFNAAVFEEFVFRLLLFVIWVPVTMIILSIVDLILNFTKWIWLKKGLDKKLYNVILYAIMIIPFVISHKIFELWILQLVVLLLQSFLLVYIFTNNKKIIFTILLHFFHNLFIFFILLVLSLK